MRVEATRRGYYDQLRKPGDQFVIDGPKAFSENWMKKLDADPEPAATPEPEPEEAEEAEEPEPKTKPAAKKGK